MCVNRLVKVMHPHFMRLLNKVGEPALFLFYSDIEKLCKNTKKILKLLKKRLTDCYKFIKIILI